MFITNGFFLFLLTSGNPLGDLLSEKVRESVTGAEGRGQSMILKSSTSLEWKPSGLAGGRNYIKIVSICSLIPRCALWLMFSSQFHSITEVHVYFWVWMKALGIVVMLLPSPLPSLCLCWELQTQGRECQLYFLCSVFLFSTAPTKNRMYFLSWELL